MMKRTLLFLSLILGMLTSTASAAVDNTWSFGAPYVNDNLPASGQFKSIYQVAISWRTTLNPMPFGFEFSLPFQVVASNGTTEYIGTLSDASGMMGYAVFSPAITAPGTYSITVPENVCHYKSGDIDSSNDVYVIKNAFTIEGDAPAGPEEGDILKVSVFAVNGEMIEVERDMPAVIYDPVENMGLAIYFSTNAMPESPAFEENENNVYDWSKKIIAKELANGVSYEGVAAPCEEGGILVAFDPAITAVGSYDVIIPAGLMTIDNRINKEYTAEGLFEIRPAVVENPLSHYTVTPENGAEVTEIPTITVTFTGLAEDQKLFGESNVNMTVLAQTPDGDEVELKATVCEDRKSATVNFPAGYVPVEGEYVVTLPEELFALALSEEEPDMSVMSPEIIITFIYKAPQTGENIYFEDITINPAPGSYESLDGTFVIKFPNLGNGNFINSSREYVSVLKDGEHYADLEIYTINWRDVRFNFNATESGVYTVEFPENTLYVSRVEDDEEVTIATYDKPLTFTYTVGTLSGVEAIDGEVENYTVVDLAGRVVVKNAGKSALNNLENGLYIINGKKIAICK